MDDAGRSSAARLSGIATNPGRNMPDAFFNIRRSFQAREILIALEKHGSGNDALFYAWLGTIGLGPSLSDLAALLDQLEADGFIVTERIEQRRVIKPTRAGIEIAQARIQAEWIARADPE
jgi:hypothetical protein